MGVVLVRIRGITVWEHLQPSGQKLLAIPNATVALVRAVLQVLVTTPAHMHWQADRQAIDHKHSTEIRSCPLLGAGTAVMPGSQGLRQTQ